MVVKRMLTSVNVGEDPWIELTRETISESVKQERYIHSRV
jgi:hypothetical protein